MLDEHPEVLDRFANSDSLIDIGKELAGLEDHEAEYIQDIPMALREGIRAAIVEAAAVGQGHSPPVLARL